MTRLEAQQRNWGIAQLIGILPRIQRLIPEDVADDYIYFNSIQEQADSLVKLLKDAKVKKFICKSCANSTGITTGFLTRNKTAYYCDICNTYHSELYTIKKKQKE